MESDRKRSATSERDEQNVREVQRQMTKEKRSGEIDHARGRAGRRPGKGRGEGTQSRAGKERLKCGISCFFFGNVGVHYNPS